MADSGNGQLRAVKKRTVKIADAAFGPEMEHGTGQVKYHRFSSMSFKDEKAYQKYATDTGLEVTDVQQNWGPVSGDLRRSRRGSISGMVELPNGSVSAFRWSSRATTIGLDAQDQKGNPETAYANAGRDISTSAKNSKDKPISPNAVLADMGHVVLDPNSGVFGLEDAAYAQGISATALDKRRSSSVQSLYGKGIQTALDFGNKPTAAQTYHSEPMSVAFLEQDLGHALIDDSDRSMMVTSIPNQVCFNCGRMYQQNTGPRSHTSGMPGKEFGGQKPGQMDIEQPDGPAVFRANPTSEILASQQNTDEVRHIFDYHKK
ncbi:hypothetical protein [Teredinibacter sp. KSP-S5-2]|uniref:hypothetical protein n=1 Tax=Teredinibacter sp. KSP-S5-2 TaxID=3034506 RepID=UPI002934346A|nr:hypothetical protein [Teredinibacter sp. KSP-S5-2]WNO11623.1 hypothetical protein P5V12_10615 [Teredinibacter sp. KSP-S5-2]